MQWDGFIHILRHYGNGRAQEYSLVFTPITREDFAPVRRFSSLDDLKSFLIEELHLNPNSFEVALDEMKRCYPAKWRNFPATLQGHNPCRPPTDEKATWSEITTYCCYSGVSSVTVIRSQWVGPGPRGWIELVEPKSTWSKRYQQINGFEHMLRESGARIIKFLLYINKEEQAGRFRAPGRQIDELRRED